MRLSVLLIAVIVVLAIVFFPVPASAQHGGGGSHASSSGGFSSGSTASVSHATVSSTSRTSSSSSKGNATSRVTVSSSRAIVKTTARPAWKPTVCRGSSCPCLGGGARNSLGNCAVQAQIGNCAIGNAWQWNGYACGDESFFNDCRQLSDQLATQQRTILRSRSMREILRYHLLNDQYSRCATAFHYTLAGLTTYD